MNLLKTLVGIKSYSCEENELSDYIASYFKDRDYIVYVYKGNVIVHIKKNSRNCIIFNAHMDTVKVQSGWVTDPFELTEIDGRYYGLGVSDNKVSCSILMEIAEHIRSSKEVNSDVILSFVVEEEVGGVGTKDFISFFESNFNFEKSISVVCEPRNARRLSVGCKGNVMFKATFMGKASHSSRPECGENAILKALNFTIDIPKDVDLLGNTTLAYPTVIEGGTSRNTVPDLCVAYGNVRTNLLLHEYIMAQLNRCDFIDVIYESLPFYQKTQPLIDAFLKLGVNDVVVSSGRNDSIYFGFANIPVVVFGAGNAECCHVSNEYVDIVNIQKTKDIYLGLCESFVFE